MVNSTILQVNDAMNAYYWYRYWYDLNPEPDIGIGLIYIKEGSINICLLYICMTISVSVLVWLNIWKSFTLSGQIYLSVHGRGFLKFFLFAIIIFWEVEEGSSFPWDIPGLLGSPSSCCQPFPDLLGPTTCPNQEVVFALPLLTLPPVWDTHTY